MNGWDDKVVDAFLEQQLKLFPEKVAQTREEAAEFLEESMAVVCRSIAEVRAYFEENFDVTDQSDEELREASEVFVIPDGRFLVVEG